MAGVASYGGMGAAKGELLRMLKNRLAPGGRHRSVTFLAIQAEIRQRMVGVNSLIEIIYMTPFTLHRSIDEFFATLRDMTGVAIRDNMDSHQRESPLGVSLHDILSILPVDGSMAVSALDTELGPVNVGMAIGALYADIGKPQILMTAPAGGVLVRAGKRKARPGMRKAGRFLYEFPSLSGMTGVTIPGYIAVRAFPGAKIVKDHHQKYNRCYTEKY